MKLINMSAPDFATAVDFVTVIGNRENKALLYWLKNFEVTVVERHKRHGNPPPSCFLAADGKWRYPEFNLPELQALSKFVEYNGHRTALIITLSPEEMQKAINLIKSHEAVAHLWEEPHPPVSSEELSEQASFFLDRLRISPHVLAEHNQLR